MNEFDDLFEEKPKQDFDDLFKDNPKQELVNNNSGMDGFNNYVNKQHKNGILLMIYIVITFVFSYALQIVVNNQFPDTNLVLSSIEDFSEVQVSVSDNPSGSTEYPYLFSITGSLKNNYEEEIPVIYYEIEFFDENEESMGVYYYQDENIVSGEIMRMNEEVESSDDYTTYTVSHGFDVSANLYTFFNLLPVIICAFAFFLIDRESFKADKNSFKQNPKKFFGQIATGFFMVFMVLQVSNLLLQLLGVYGTSQNEMSIQRLFNDDPLQLVMLFFLLCVFTPIVEEVVFRKIIYNFVEPRSNYKIAIAATGIIFGLMHVLAYGDFIQSIPYIMMGLTFGYIYYRSNKNIYVTIGVHFLNNLLSYVLYLISIVFAVSA
jgi:hypothetical protein